MTEGLLRKTGDAQTLIPWADIAEVYLNETAVALKTFMPCRIVTSAGETIVIDNRTRDHHQLGEKIAGAVAERLLPVANQALQQGKEITFGNVRLSMSRVGYKDRQIPWHGVSHAGCCYDHRFKAGLFFRSIAEKILRLRGLEGSGSSAA